MFEWYEGEVRALEQREAEAPRAPVVFYGSSSIRLWTTLGEDFAGTPLVNAGFGGSTLAACAYYFERLVLPLRPRSLVFYAGDNDLGDGQAPDAVIASLHDLLGKIERGFPAIPFGFISIKPSPARESLLDSIRQVNDAARSMLNERPEGVYLDVYTAMLSDSGGPRPELFTEDGLHLNRMGYRLWWQVISARRNALRL